MAKLRPAAASLAELEAILGLDFTDKARLERALTHASLKQKGADRNYERLEFLGDRVLGLLVAEKLFELYPGSGEGDLSVRLNALVSADTCAEVADEIGLQRFIRHGGDLKRSGSAWTKNIRADVVEALIAAAYLDGGLALARRFVLRFWEGRLSEAAFARRDPKTELQEWAHKRCGRPPVYETVERSGPDHDPVFTVRALVPGAQPSEGSGRSKRLAEQEAASVMLRREGVWSADA